MKAWEKPRLIVLLRSKPEEAVLEGCKSGYLGEIAGSPANYVQQCSESFAGLGCRDCFGVAVS